MSVHLCEHIYFDVFHRSNQTVLIDTLVQENGKFRDCTAHDDLSEMVGT